MKKETWQQLGIVSAIVIAVPVVGSAIVQTVAIWELPSKVSHLESRFDTFDAKLNGLAGHFAFELPTNQPNITISK